MRTCKLAYRHMNGEVEGFTGVGSNAASAKTNAINKIKNKCAGINQPFYENKVILSVHYLHQDEIPQVREDWKISARSDTI